MRVATGTQNLRALHAMTIILFFLDTRGIERLPKTRPATAGMVFRIGAEQRRAAASTEILAFSFIIIVLATKSRLGALLPENAILLRRQLLPPLVFRLLDLLHRSTPPRSACWIERIDRRFCRKQVQFSSAASKAGRIFPEGPRRLKLASAENGVSSGLTSTTTAPACSA